jgi:hypothetical protein
MVLVGRSKDIQTQCVPVLSETPVMFSVLLSFNQNYEIITTTNNTENITDVSESTVTHYI